MQYCMTRRNHSQWGMGRPAMGIMQMTMERMMPYEQM